MKGRNPASRTRRQWLGGSIAAATSALVGLVLFLFAIGGGVQRFSFDLPFAFKSGLRFNDVVLIYLDEASHAALKQPTTLPWDRSLHASLIERLTAAGASAIVFDILFTDPSANPAADERLAAAIAQSRRVILAGMYMSGEPLPQNKITGEEMPYEIFRQGAVAWGNANLLIDPDDGIRRYFPNVRGVSGQSNVLWLPAAVAHFVNPGGGPAEPSNGRLPWLNYYGAPRTLTSVSYYQALLPQGVPPEFFKNKVVFVGAHMAADFSGSEKDEFRTPYSFWGGELSSGVEIHATAALNLLHKEWLRQLPFAAELSLVLVTALLSGFALMRFQPFPATLLALAVIVCVVLAAHALVLLGGVWFAWIVEVFEIGVALFCSVLANSLSLFVEKRLLEQSLAAHLSPSLVKRLCKDPTLRQLGGSQQEISMLFSDIANFSGVSASMPSDDLLRLVNKYYEAALECIYETDGTVVSLIGDAIFAIWNAPVEQTDHRERACRSASNLRLSLARFGASGHNLPLRTRIGLHTGVACVGNIGSANHFEYTALGENTNLASRLEGLNRYLGTEVLVTREVQRAVENSLLWRPVGHFRLKGAGRVVEVNELVGPLDLSEPSKAWREQFAQALHDFRRRKFDSAAERFQKVAALRRIAEPDFIPSNSTAPGDGPSQFYLEKIRELSLYPPSTEWLGEIDLREK